MDERRRRPRFVACALHGLDTARADLFDSLAGFPEAQFGNAAGQFIPKPRRSWRRPVSTIGEKTGWFGALRWRYLSVAPLTEDGVLQSPPLASSTAGWATGSPTAGASRSTRSISLMRPATTRATLTERCSRPTPFSPCAFATPKIPVAVCQNEFMDYSIHRIEPMAFRLTIAGPLNSIDVYGMAAEFGRAVPVFTPPSRNYDWTGFYVGGYGEYSWASTSGSAVNLATAAAASPVTPTCRTGTAACSWVSTT